MTESGNRYGGLRLLVTAGPTAEDIDPVRYITNRSTGRMGIALAGAARDAGAGILLVLGPTDVPPPDGVRTLRVRSADEMLAAVRENLSWSNALVMTAAVADYAPAEPLTEKLKKKDGDLYLRLRRTPDILAETAKLHYDGARIGFSLDVGIDTDEGRRKLERKKLDLIVVNSAASFASSLIDAVLVDAKGGTERLGVVSKTELSRVLIDRIAALNAADRLQERNDHGF